MGIARGAMMSVYSEARRLGVKFRTGASGSVKSFIKEEGDVVGVEIDDGS